MAIARNIVAFDVPLDDLAGITVLAGQDYDLSLEPSDAVAGSQDLITAINNDEIILLNADGTPMTKAESLGAASQTDNDRYVAVTAEDTTPDYLSSKLAAGTNITLNILNPGVNEQIEIVAAGGGGGGESNTASNQGTTGVGVFIQKTGVDLEFKNINIGSNKLILTDDVANNEIDLDVAEGNIVHQNLSGAGTNTHAQIDTHIADATLHFTEASISHLNIQDIGTNSHAQIDTHIADTNNPHATDIANLTDTLITTPADSEALVWNGTTMQWENVLIPVPPAGGGRLIQVAFSPIGALSGTASIPVSAAAPLVTQGAQLWSQGITPTLATSAVRVHTTATLFCTTSSMEVVLTVFRDSTPIGASIVTNPNKNSGTPISFTIYDTPNTTSPLTYSVRVGKNGGPGTWYINDSNTDPGALGGILTNNSYSLEEIGV